MANYDLSERPIDIAFCRAYHEAWRALDDAEVLAQAQVAADRALPLNPTEFLQQVVAAGTLPADFDWQEYADLLGDPMLSEPWRATLHFLRCGQSGGLSHRWPFVPDFYRQLYHPDATWRDDDALAREWHGSGGKRFGCLLQAARAGGFASLDWQRQFDAAAYVSYNGLFALIANDTQAIVHFLTVGWRQLLPLSRDLEFEPQFVRELGSTEPNASDAELYRRWIEAGLPAGAPPSEAALLRTLELELDAVPGGFDWQTYLRERPALPLEFRSKWGALEHLVRFGAIEPGTLPLPDEAAWTLLIEIARRAARQGDMSRALHIVERCSLFGPPAPVHLQSVGEIEHLAGRHARALHAFRQVRDAGAHSLLTFLRAAECSLALGDAAESAAWALAGLAVYPRSEHLDRLLLQAQHTLYDTAITRHIAAMRPGAAWPSSIRADLQTLYDGMLAGYRSACGVAGPDTTPSAPLPDRKLRIVMLANVDLPQCTFYRVTQKQQQLSTPTAHITIVERDQWHDFLTASATADVAIFYRVHASVPVLRCMAYCQANAIPTLYEIDDLVFDPEHFPDTLESYDGAVTAHQHFELACGVPLVRFALQSCDYAIASTEALRRRMEMLVRRHSAVVHRNCLPGDVLAVAATLQAPGEAHPGDRVVIFYGSATRAHAADFRQLIEPALSQLMREQPEVCFLACGHVDVSRLAAAFPGRVEYVAFQSDRAEYARLLASADINLAVLIDNAFNDCKSEIKWLEAAMLSVPTVASNVAGMREVAAAPADLLVCGPDCRQWLAALRSLVVDPARRRAIGDHARMTALARYQPLEHGRRLERHLRSLLASSGPTSTARARTRVLVVNVFYPPQSIGGATRVVSDQVAALCAQHGQDFTVAVACGNAEDALPYRLTSYLHAGVRVYSISTGFKADMDWFAVDPQVSPLFQQVLDAFQPDLVHFHCIQRLGAGIVEATAERGIPYVVTLHDAWWISDHQFLLDATGRPAMPWQEDRCGTAANPHSRSASLGRRRRLRSCLDGAAAVNAVSAAFATIYHRAGVTGVRAIPNGVPALPPLQPCARPAGRLRIGHFGGMGPAKGLHLLRNTLKRNNYPALQLLAVDDASNLGHVRHEHWGATEVTVVGRLPQGQVGSLYGRIDVLVAPSIWPESFGLVVREALAYGKWVIAAARGALAEAIVAGENGFVFDPDDPEALASALRMLNNDPERFAAPPAPSACPRRTADQTADFVALYRTILDGAAKHSAVVARVA